MKGQLLKEQWNAKPFVCPNKLIVHFKRGYAQSIGRTTETFEISSRADAMNILFSMYENKVAFAQIKGTDEEFEFVKRQKRHGKHKKLRSKIQQRS